MLSANAEKEEIRKYAEGLPHFEDVDQFFNWKTKSVVKVYRQ